MALIQRGKKGTYHAVIYIEGKPVWKSLRTSDKIEAKILYGEKLKQLTGRSPFPDPRPSNAQWGFFVDQYLKDSKYEKTDHTIYCDQSRIGVFQRGTGITSSSELTPGVLKKYRGMREAAGKMYWTINRQLATLKHLARWGQSRGYVDRQLDFREVKPLKIDRKKNRFVFSRAEIKTITKTLNQAVVDTENLGVKKNVFTYTSEHQRGILRVAAALGRYAGMRPGEARAARWPDFDFTTMIAKVSLQPGWAPKDREEREVPMFKELGKILLQWQRLLKKLSLYDERGHVLLMENGRRPGPGYLSRIFSRLLKSLGLSKGRLYTWRHTYGTYMLDLVDLGTLQEYMGHEDIGTTQIYVHARRERLKELAGQKAPV